ncbi:MAG TPA: response regulator transcription factor [Aggregatilineales bacterium]|nr:response regulator transcription factor [Aggregatilineales bacterium]
MENKRLLIVEDDSVTQQILRTVFERAGFQVTIVGDAPDALRVIQQQGLPHLAIVDLQLPSMHGFTLSERIKRMGDVPIVILTANRSEDILIQGITEYAEDFIVKPFNNREIVARVGRILSRIPDFSYTNTPTVYVDEHLSIDFTNNWAFLDGQKAILTPIEARLLSILMRNKGRYVSPDMLIARVWPNKEIYEETLRVHMSRLRSKIQPDERHPYIRTERGTGYAFMPPDEEGYSAAVSLKRPVTI